MSARRACRPWAALPWLLLSLPALAGPVLFTNARLQGPVHAGPDELLMLAGAGLAADDVVVYRALERGRSATPDTVPESSDGREGVAKVESADGSAALVVRFPPPFEADRAYALFVRAPGGEWSAPAVVNDARPLWLSPAVVFAQRMPADLPRSLKVIGRNLAPVGRATTQVRLSGPEILTLAARVEPRQDLSQVVAQVPLPPRLMPGLYALQVSRDGENWVPLAGQSLQVKPDPVPAPDFRLDDPAYGNCRAGDATGCLQKAILAARAAGGGTVQVPKGEFILRGSVELPLNVSLVGEGTADSSLIRADAPCAGPALVLLGGNAVRALRLADRRRYRPEDAPCAFLQLGRPYRGPAPGVPAAQESVDDIELVGNLFDRTSIAIGDSGRPMHRLFITHNEFGAYRRALDLQGNRYNTTLRYRIDDSVIAFNRFLPGAYSEPAIGQGTLASELGASHHLDFSSNTADGTAVRYLDDPADARGWRAGFFWMLNNNHEMTLVSDNLASCTGDRVGDGEAFGFDNNGATPAFDGAVPVVDSAGEDVVVRGALRSVQNQRAVPLDQYYLEHWVYIVEGPGVGQARKIRGYRAESDGRVRFQVTPAWDVPPQAGQSRVIVNRAFWQLYAVGNTIEQRKPPCEKSNRTGRKGGVISVWAPTLDSLVAGNVQHDTDGILFNQTYNLPTAGCAECESADMLQYFLEIRGNRVDGEYDWDSNCSASGIAGYYGAAPSSASPPPVMSFGVAIAGNSVSRADGLHGGAISTMLSWHAGPNPHNWPMVRNLVIQHNRIEAMTGTPAAGSCKVRGLARTGISLDSAALERGTLLYGNRCAQVPTPLHDGARSTYRLCAGQVDACECPR